MIIRNQNPKGGTELQFNYLEEYVDKKLLDQVQITTSVPEKIPLHPDKVNILWQKNSYDQPNRSEEHTSELQSRLHLVCRLLLEKKKKKTKTCRRTHN